MKKIALITGIGGQDGAYLARLLLQKGYTVHGTSRDAERSPFGGLEVLNIIDAVDVHSMAVNDFRSVMQIITTVKPDEIYHLAGQSSVGLSFEQPVETFESIIIATLNILEVIRFIGREIKFYNACSSECFGETSNERAKIDAPFLPKSPYAVAKSASFWAVANYREAYGLYACSGILFNHESPLRPERFVTKKIVSAACRIADGSDEKLRLGNLSIRRDWGWAPEYVEAMWLMLQHSEPEDFVIATGVDSSLENFVQLAFEYLDLDWKEHVEILPQLMRPADPKIIVGDPDHASIILGWQAKNTVIDVVHMMIDAELDKKAKG